MGLLCHGSYAQKVFKIHYFEGNLWGENAPSLHVRNSNQFGITHRVLYPLVLVCLLEFSRVTALMHSEL